MNIVCIILVQASSESLVRKNIMDFCGKPLLAWSILQATQSSYVNGIYVYSDSNQIHSIAEQYNAIPIVGPIEIFGDGATSETALSHALDSIENAVSQPVDLVVSLKPTLPLREPDDIDATIRLLLENEADSALSATVLANIRAFQRRENSIVGINYDPSNPSSCQERFPIYHDNGSIYVFRPDVMRRHFNRLGGKIAVFKMPSWKSQAIDTREDIDLCCWYFKKYLMYQYLCVGLIDRPSLDDIDLFVYDFDGVMTDNRAIVLQDGTEGVIVNRADGLAIDILRSCGKTQLILSTEKNHVVRARAKKLGLEIIDSCDNKNAALKDYCKSNNFALKRTAYVGNDINDLAAIRAVGISISPADAHPVIKANSKIVLKTSGGSGVIRGLVDMLYENEDY